MLRCLFYILLVGSMLHAEYPPGQIRLTPKIDLHLEPVPVEGLPDHTLNLPPGFKVKLFSDQVDKARFMAWDDQGVLHVANMKTRFGNQWRPASGRQSTVLALPDKDGDGRADTVYKAADDFHWPHSVAFYQGVLFVADDFAIYRLEDRDSDGFYEERVVFAEVPGFMGRSSEHVTHTLVFDEFNDKLYFHIGSGCDLCREDDPERSTVIQMNTDGSGRRIFASGLRNAIGLDLHPVTGELWGAGNGHDREGRDLPPEWITPLRDGGFYGWPLAYAYQVWTDFSIDSYRRAIFPLTRCRFAVGCQHGAAGGPRTGPLGTDGAAFLRSTTNFLPSTNTPRLSPSALAFWATIRATRSWHFLPSRMGPTPASPTFSLAFAPTPTKRPCGVSPSG